MVKNFKLFFTRTEKAFGAESEYIASGIQNPPSLFTDGCKLAFDLFTARSNLRPYTFILGKC